MSDEIDDSNTHITKEVMNAYISVIKEHTEQMSSVVSSLAQVSLRLGELEDHLNDGFKSDIIDHNTSTAEKIIAQIDKVGTVAATLAATNDKSSVALSALNEKNSIALAALNDKNTTATMVLLDKSMSEVKSALKINTITNAIGWAGLLITIILKIFGKM